MIWLPDDPKFTRMYVNAGYCHFFGVSPKEIIGHSAALCVPPENRADTVETLRQIVAEKATHISIETVAKADGSRALVRWRDTPIVDDCGKVIEIHSIGEQVKDRRSGERRSQRERERERERERVGS